MNWRERISADPAVCHGKACIKGTRVMVSVVLDNIADGLTPDAVAQAYHVAPDDVHAALLYAAELAKESADRIPISKLRPRSKNVKPNMDWLIGMRIECVEFNGYQWFFRMADRICLSIECPWQIIAEGRVRLARGDHGQQYGLPAPINAVDQAQTLLRGRRISNISADQASADLAITFEGDVLMRTFNDSSGFEAWQVTGPNGEDLIAQGGGNIITFPDAGSDYLCRADAKGYLKVLEVLRAWDPIGVISESNQDEYDSYAAGIVRMLDGGVTTGDLAKHMTGIVVEGMGIAVDRKKTRECAQQLVDFWKVWKPQ